MFGYKEIETKKLRQLLWEAYSKGESGTLTSEFADWLNTVVEELK